MEISTDFRRKMILILIKALKESSSFSDISDSQLKEAVLNSEHQTFQQSKSKEEYIYHINEKLRKIKQSSIQRFDIQNEDRPLAQKINTGEEKLNIINGKLPPHVKVSQVYTQEGQHPASRKNDTFHLGFEGQQRPYLEKAQQSSIFPGSHEMEPLESPGQSYLKAEAGKQFTGYAANQQGFGCQQIGYVHENMGYEAMRNDFNSRQRASYINQQPKGYQQRMPAHNKQEFVSNESKDVNLYNKPEYPENTKGRGKVQDKQPGYGFLEPTCRNPGFYYQGPMDTSQYPATAERNSAYGFYDGNDGNQRKMAYMFESAGGRYKTDMYSDKFNAPFIKRSDPSTTLGDLENDPRLVRNPSFRREAGQEDSERGRKNMHTVSTKAAIMSNVKSPGSHFEYSYGSNMQPSSRSYVGNINPTLLEQNDKCTQPAPPFDEKRSEELFRSFSEEFMKTNSHIGCETEQKKQTFCEEETISRVKSEQQGTFMITPEFLETGEEEIQLPEKLQVFLRNNGIFLKEVGNINEWKKLFEQVYKKHICAPKDAKYSFSHILEIQSEFPDYPICDENDLKKYLEVIEIKDIKPSLKHSKDDYLEFIDKAIKAFSEKVYDGPEFQCKDQLATENLKE
ncbi:hypothetical protein GINT2_002136 [Glugoides intestinalis]